MHILIFARRNVCYDSYFYFARALAKALEEQGHTAELFPFSTPFSPSLEQLCGRTFDAALDFNSDLPKLTMEEGGYFLDQIHAPFYDILLDHPLYHHNTLKQPVAHFHALCLDENHKNYIETYYSNISSVHLFSVTGEDIFPDSCAYPDKEIDVLFCGTYTDYRQVDESIQTCPSFLGDLTRTLIDLMLEDASLTQEEALRRLLPTLEEAEIIEETFPLHMQACFLCDSFLRAFRRETLLTSLAKEGVPLTLCGNGWRRSPLCEFPQTTIVDDTSFVDTFALFRKAKMTLNLLPEFKNGAHDRIFSSMLNHSLTLTDASPFLRERFQDRLELCFFDVSNPSGLAEQIFEGLSSPKLVREISQRGYFAAKETCAWDTRAKDLLRIL